MLYRLQIDIEGRDDALALAALIREMGYEVKTFAHERNDVLPPSQTRSGKILLSRMEPRRCYPISEVEIWLEEADYSPSTARSLISALIKEGAVERMRLATGFYRKSATFNCAPTE